MFVHYHPLEEKDAKDVKEYISKVAPNAQVELYAADLRTEDECLKLVEAAKKWSGGEIHILVNNHATQNEVPKIEELSSEQWRHVSFRHDPWSFADM